MKTKSEYHCRAEILSFVSPKKWAKQLQLLLFFKSQI